MGEFSRPAAMPKPPPTNPSQLAQFEIVRRLGAGGMAEVFLAKKRGAEGTYKLLVVKRILPTHGASRRFRAMFVEEAQLATRLNHPNVVQVYEFYDGGDEGQLLAMEYVEGCDLGRLMAAAKRQGMLIPPLVGAWIVAEAAKGLHYAHEKKDEAGQRLEIVHRDVSPQNILLSYDGAVKIADFGIASAKFFVEEQGVLKGKFGYMSPEQARGERVDRRSDLYALGVIFWEILTGRPIHGGLGGEALLDIVRSGNVEPPSTYAKDIPPELELIVMRALAPALADRYQTGRELASAIGLSLMLRQELIDAAALETIIGQLVTRDPSRTGPSEPPPLSADSRASIDARTQAAAPMARSGVDGAGGSLRLVAPQEGSVAGAHEEHHEDEGAPTPDPAIRPLAIPLPVSSTDGPREVRHVAVVTWVLHGLDALRAQDPVLAQRTLDRLHTMLDDLAFKRAMRWDWKGDGEARAIAGLTSNPARAASDAAWLALDTHEAVAGFKEDLPMPLGAAIGIVRGIAAGTRDPQGHLVDFVLHDPATYLADVLSKVTPVHRTWVAGGVYRLARKQFRWGDAPTLQIAPNPRLPDVPPTMRIYALERSLSREERVNEVLGASNDLVGREAEKADLHAAYHQAVSGNTGAGELTCRVVMGELGIGKTALVLAFLNELPPNARIVRVECSPVRMEIPYSSVAELIRDAVGTTGEEPFEEVAELIARAGGGATAGADASAPVVTRLAELATNRPMGGEDEDAFARKKLVGTGVRRLLAAIAMQQPLVVLVEGLQWADKPSLELFAELAAAKDPLPILVVIVTRPEDRVTPALEGSMRIELRGLTAEEQVRLVETRLGVREGVRGVCADLVPKVAGNPFFLLEMIDALLERGALEIRELDPQEGEEPVHVLARTERVEAGLSALPSTLEQLLGDRIRELPPEEHAVVDWLAIAGGPLPSVDLLKLTKGGLASSDAEAYDDEAIVRLCARGLCDRKGELIDFRHPLTRDVAYASIAAQDRVRMHRRLGEHLAGTSLARGLSAAIVARHLTRGDAGAQAIDFYLEAAVAARRGYQTPLAVRYFQRALGLLPEGDRRRITALEALEAIYRVLGRRRDRIKQLEALRRMARGAGTPRVVSLALLRTARFELDEGHLSRGVVTAERAAEVARSAKLTALEVEAEGLVSEFLRELGDVQGALAACDRALAAADPVHNPDTPLRAYGEVLRTRGVLLRRVGRVREAVDAYVDAIAIFRRVGARRLEARAKSALAFAMYVQGRYEDAIALALESIQIDLSIGGRFQLARTLTNIGLAYGRLGDTSRGEAYLKRARDAHDRYGDQDGRADTLLVSADLALEKGDLTKAEQWVGDAGALISATGNAYTQVEERIMRARLARAKGEAHEAVAHVVEARRGAEHQALVAYHFYGMAFEAALRADLGEMHAATLLATTALGAVETLQGCEYGLEIRVLAADALRRAASPQAGLARERAVSYAVALMNTIRDPRLRRLFTQRPLVAPLLRTIPPAPYSRAPGAAHNGDGPSDPA
jgi:serine/threonine protein kinase/tetratricopeptide (TPR) repeat protein